MAAERHEEALHDRIRYYRAESARIAEQVSLASLLSELYAYTLRSPNCAKKLFLPANRDRPYVCAAHRL